MSSYFYHCSVNTADILNLGELKRGSSQYLGFKSISFFYEEKRGIPESDRYYDAPDNKQPSRFGESIFPVKSAFCFESGALKKLFPEGYKNKQGWDEKSGLIKKGSQEYLFPGDLKLKDLAFWGIRVPDGYADSMTYYVRAIAVLFLLNLPDIRVAYGCNDFYKAHTKFWKIRDRLNELKPITKLSKDTLELVNERIKGIRI